MDDSKPTPSPDAELYLGVDPGLARTGYAVIERTARGPVLREGGIVSSTSSKSLAQRVHEIGSGVQEVLDEFQPQVMAIEEVFSYGVNPKTAILMAHARGTILMAAAEREITVIHYAARSIKKMLTGSGRASKEQMQFAIQNELKLTSVPEPHDIADASAVALCSYHSLRRAA